MTRQRAYVLDADEHLWSGFLVDLNLRDVAPQLKNAHVTVHPHDPETVHEAWNEYRTIVTSDESDFIRFILEHQKRDSGRRCQDCWGLLLLPSGEIARQRLLPHVKNGVSLGGSVIPWRAIGYANLCVSLHVDGSIGVRRFRRCDYCRRNTPIDVDWYKALSEIGTRRS
jgi:hypothetical protein